MPPQPHIVLRDRQRLSHRHQKLQMNKIKPRHHLCHRMLYLQPRIHLKKIKVLLRVHKELDSPRIHIPRRQRQPHRRLTHPPPQVLTDDRRRCLLNHLLMTPLHRTFALAQIHAVPIIVRHQLDLNVPRPLDQLLQIDLTRSKAPLRLTTRRRKRRSKLLRLRHRAHAFSAATGSRLQHHRIPNPRSDTQRLRNVRQSRHTPRNTRHRRSVCCLPRLGLRPQHPHGTRRWPDESYTRRGTSLCELRVL